MSGRDSDCLGKQRGARPGKQREETALHPDPETGRAKKNRKRPPTTVQNSVKQENRKLQRKQT